jgi:hypothetical protein
MQNCYPICNVLAVPMEMMLFAAASSGRVGLGEVLLLKPPVIENCGGRP